MIKSKDNSHSRILGAFLMSALAVAISACGGESSPWNNRKDVVRDDSIKLNGKNNAGVTLDVAEYGDIFSGRPFLLSYAKQQETEPLSDYGEKDTGLQPFRIQAEFGDVSDTHPVTGAEAPEGTVYYTVPERVLYATQDGYGFTEKFTVYDEEDNHTEFTMNVGADTRHGDPVFPDQWHIRNIGQNPFSFITGPVSGYDAGVIPAWHLTDADGNPVSGRNVKVAVLDEPIDFNHEDLKDRRFTPDGKGLYGVNLDNSSDMSVHGTEVAGIIGATAGNGKGVRGIGYESLLTSYYYGDAPFSYLTDPGNVSMVSASLGYDSSYSYMPELEMYFQSMLENNIPFIRAAGNEYYSVSFDGSRRFSDECTLRAVNCQFNQTSSFNRARYAVNVASLNSQGVRASYSSTGSYIWVTGFGGEPGYYDLDFTSPGIVTTKSSRDPQEYADAKDAGTPWRLDPNYYDLRKYYTHTFSGTSTATPTVSGVVALIKQAKPDITVPQIRYILAVTSSNDKTPGWSSLDYGRVIQKVEEMNNASVTLDAGWHENGAGLRYSNYYGFGVLNAEAAVKLALSCDDDEECSRRSELPLQYRSYDSAPCSSSDNGRTVTCYFSRFVNSDTERKVEGSFRIDNVAFDMAGFTYAAEPDVGISECSEAGDGNLYSAYYANSLMQIEMTSPRGTLSIIKPVYANWDFDGAHFRTTGEIDGVDGEFLLTTSDFFNEHMETSEVTRLRIRSVCPVDVKSLNKSMKLVMDVYPD